jgi:hypothetical protein
MQMDNAMTAEPVFPVLCLSQDSSISVAESPERLHRANALAFFRNRYFEDMIVMDSQARQFRVVGADVVPALSVSGRWTARLLNKSLRVNLRLAPQGPGSLDDAKRIVAGWLDRAPDFWEASRDIGEWKDMVARADTARVLIALFS